LTDSAIFPTLETYDEDTGEGLDGLDDLLASLRSDDEPAPKRSRGRAKAKKEAPAKDFKAVLWASADKLRAQMNAAEYKHLVLGLIFLKYISDTFAAQQGKIQLSTRHRLKTGTTTPRRTCSGCLLMLAGNR